MRIYCVSFFEDENLKLKFNYKDYSFKILTNGKSFKFTELSDGFVAILDIVADLILRMQSDGSLSMEFSKPGIVMIDEIETHLHLKLQKMILPMLTTLFPNIQFIVTSHSPFVLSSLPNATAYDLEHQEPITNLTDYSYQALSQKDILAYQQILIMPVRDIGNWKCFLIKNLCQIWKE